MPQPAKRTFARMEPRFIWIGLGLLTLFLKWLFAVNPFFTEVVYSRGIFVVYRWLWDYTLGWLPFPWLYVMVPLILGLLAWQVWRNIQRHRGLPIRNRLGRMLLGLLSFVGMVLTLFFFTWGFNYYRQPIATHLDLPTQQMSKKDLVREFQQATADLLAAYHDRTGLEDSALTEDVLPEDLEATMRAALQRSLQEISYPSPGRVRGRIIRPEGMMIQLGASGIYIPFWGEGHVDAALPAASRPFTLAHEMGHAYGFGDEGTCNFLAVLACEASQDPVVRYAGRLVYWRYVAVAYRRLYPEAYASFRPTLPLGILADLDTINAVYLRFPGFFPKLSSTVYDAYLKGQGIKEGLASYDQVVGLVAAWRRSQQGTVSPGGEPSPLP